MQQDLFQDLWKVQPLLCYGDLFIYLLRYPFSHLQLDKSRNRKVGLLLYPIIVRFYIIYKSVYVHIEIGVVSLLDVTDHKYDHPPKRNPYPKCKIQV